VALKDGEAKPAESITVTWIVFDVVEVVASVLAAVDAVRVASGALLAVALAFALLVADRELVVALVDVLGTLVRLTTARGRVPVCSCNLVNGSRQRSCYRFRRARASPRRRGCNAIGCDLRGPAVVVCSGAPALASG